MDHSYIWDNKIRSETKVHLQWYMKLPMFAGKSLLGNVWHQREDAPEIKIPLVKAILVQDGKEREAVVGGDSVACCEDIPTDSLKNGSVIVTERNTGSTANFSCDAGLSLVGRQSIICTASGWNGNIPQCINIVCPETVAFFRGSKYIFRCSGARWAMAETICIANGGHLTSVETGDENAFLLDVIALIRNKQLIGNANFWIGLKYNDNAKSYTWLDGKPLNYSNWYQGPPQQPDRKQIGGTAGANCGLIHQDYAFYWGDEHCFQSFKSVCEIRLT
ncbi:unnamed protein product [Mytilus edulis]|uniref:Uncharacterized protein n=1 Tax=Mytilus edulis TaxID=6550 RepID=A0A8S3QPR7_MYTED|nr:unnamed protein product [Mytilus edulis]